MPAVQLPPPSGYYDLTPEIPVDGAVGRSNAGYLAPGQTAIKLNVTNVSMTTARVVPILTTPSTKSYAITDLYISHDSTTSIPISLLVGTTTGNCIPIFTGIAKGDTAPISQQGQETQLVCPAGCTLYLSWPANAGVNLYMNMAGVQSNVGVG